MDMLNSPISYAAATLPMLWLFLGLGVLRLKSQIVCPAGLALSVLLACGVWGLAPRLAAEAVLDGTIFALLPILWVIAAAFFMYNVAQHTGADKRIRALLGGISPDARIQALIIAWGLGSFMEAVAGFGTAVVIPAAMLISLGFAPLLAATVSLLSNTIAVAFGVVGIPMQTLAWVTGLDVFTLSGAAVAQLSPLTVAVPFFIVGCVARSFKGTLEVWAPTLAAGLAFALAQFLVASRIGPELAAVAGSICSTACVAVIVRLLPPKTVRQTDTARKKSALEDEALSGAPGQAKAWSPYILLFFLVLFSSKLFPDINALLGQVKSSPHIYSGPGGKPLEIPWLLTPGTLVLSAALAGGLWQGARPAALAGIYGATLRRLAAPALTIVSIVCMAKVLSYSGMMLHLSGGLAHAAGAAYPAAAPFVGALGSFITGSDTSSNILFGDLQKQVALQLGLSPVWIAASNTSGACIGKLISPQNIALAATAAGLAGREGKLLALGLAYALPFLLFLSALVFAFA